MKPNLARIPADADAQAGAVMRRARGAITQPFLDSLNEGDANALGWYGLRHATIALRQQSAQQLREALLATALSPLIHPTDPRDLMVGLAVHHIVAQRIGTAPAALFDTIAARLPDGPIPGLLRDFGARDDITPEAFGWQLVQTAEGPDFQPAPPPKNV